MNNNHNVNNRSNVEDCSLLESEDYEHIPVVSILLVDEGDNYGNSTNSQNISNNMVPSNIHPNSSPSNSGNYQPQSFIMGEVATDSIIRQYYNDDQYEIPEAHMDRSFRDLPNDFNMMELRGTAASNHVENRDYNGISSTMGCDGATASNQPMQQQEMVQQPRIDYSESNGVEIVDEHTRYEPQQERQQSGTTPGNNISSTSSINRKEDRAYVPNFCRQHLREILISVGIIIVIIVVVAITSR